MRGLTGRAILPYPSRGRDLIDAPRMQPYSLHPRAATRAPRLVAVCGGLAAVIGAASLLARAGGRALASFPAAVRPIGVWGAADTLLLGLGLAVLALRSRRHVARQAAATLAVVALVSAPLALVAYFARPALEADMLQPVAIPVIGAAATALLLVSGGRLRDVTGALAVLVALGGLAVLLGFVYGSPVLRAATGRAVPPSAGLATLALGVGLLAQAGPEAWPLRAATGDSVRALLLRSFLPAVAVALLVADVVTMPLLSRYSAALASAVGDGVSVLLAMLVIYRLAPAVGSRVARWEQALRESEERFRLLSDAAFEGVAITEQEVLADCNDDLARMLGYAREELIGKPLTQLVAPEHVTLVLERQRTDSRERYEIRMRRKDGSTFPAETQGRTMPYHGRHVRVVAIRDVTEHHRLAEQVRQTQRMEAIGQFAGGIAHDFNNLLTAVLASGSLLEEALPPGSPLLDDVRTIRGAARRGADLSHKLLAYGRRQPLELRPLCVWRATETLVQLARRMVPENIDIVLQPGPDDATVRADAGALDQILLNCITNARDAMPDGGKIVITVDRATLDDAHRRAHGWGRPGPYVTIAVTDTGIGMDAETRRHAFEPFFTTKPVGQSSGLGLAMVYGLIKQHAGFVSLESEPGRGTTVRLYVPRDAGGRGGSRGREGRATPPHGAVSTRGGHETILVVEDDQDVRLATVRVLQKFGYHVLTANDGADALALLAAGTQRPDLILSDVVMPRMSGPQLLARLRAAGSEPKLLFASGYNSRDASEQAQLEPGIRVLGKPWTVAELLEAVREALDSDRNNDLVPG